MSRVTFNNVTLKEDRQKNKLKAGFQQADFSASADFYACADFSAYPHINFHHNTDCLIRSLFCKDLDKTKIANTSNIKLSLMCCKTSLFLPNKINYFYLH